MAGQTYVIPLREMEEDISLTRQLVQVSRIMGIEVLDHVIIGKGNFVSLKKWASYRAKGQEGERPFRSGRSLALKIKSPQGLAGSGEATLKVPSIFSTSGAI